MNKINQLLILSLLWASCSTKGSVNEVSEESGENEIEIYHYNLIIAPDLSNRTDNSIMTKPIHDSKIVELVLDNLYPKILTSQRRSQNQKDRLRLDFINKGLISEYGVNTKNLDINFGDFKNQKARIDFIMDRSEENFSISKEKFSKEFDKIYEIASKNNFGADVWSYLNNLDNSIMLADAGKNAFNKIQYQDKYKHKMIMVTDGYIEAGLYGSKGCETPKMCYYLSSNKVAEFRNAFKKSGEKDLKTFYENSGYGIVPVSNPFLENLEILAVEFNDRSLDKAGNATVQPTDHQILELFWTDWMKKSGVKKFKMKRVFSSQNEAEDEILSFLEVN